MNKLTPIGVAVIGEDGTIKIPQTALDKLNITEGDILSWEINQKSATLKNTGNHKKTG